MSEVAAAAPVASTPAPSAPPTEAGSSPVIKPGAQEAPKADSGAEPKAPAKAQPPKQYDVKVNGKVVKMSEEEALQYASLGHVSIQRFQEAAQMKKQAESLIGKLKDPKQAIAVLQDPSLGLSKDQIREAFEEWYAKEFIEPESLSPAEKRLREAEAKLQKYADDEKAREEKTQREAQEAMTAKAREEVQGQIIEALETGSLPKTNFTIRRLAYWIQRNTANGFNATTEQLVGQVRNEFNTSMRDMVESADGETLIKLLGDNLIQKLRKYDLEQLRKLRGQGTPQPTEDTTPAPQRSERPLTSSEVTQRIRQMQKTGRY